MCTFSVLLGSPASTLVMLHSLAVQGARNLSGDIESDIGEDEDDDTFDDESDTIEEEDGMDSDEEMTSMAGHRR
jgi:hypothetical protein